MAEGGEEGEEEEEEEEVAVPRRRWKEWEGRLPTLRSALPLVLVPSIPHRPPHQNRPEPLKGRRPMSEDQTEEEEGTTEWRKGGEAEDGMEEVGGERSWDHPC